MCIMPSAPCITDGYEYWLMGESSSTNAAFHSLPSFDTATFNGVRAPLGAPFGVATWLYTISCRPSCKVTASVPELLLGKLPGVKGDQVLPLSVDHDSTTAALLLRHSICSFPSLCTSILG